MKKTAVVLCPGRGTYQKTELGSLAAYYQHPLLGQIDGVRKALGLASVSELDQAERYLHALHQLPSLQFSFLVTRIFTRPRSW